MRFAHSSRLSQLTLAVCVATLMVAGGCGYQHGFLNPGDVGRYGKEPLLKPIVSTLDTGYEEPNDQFSQAQDPAPEDLVAAQQDYLVGKNDLLTISITDLMGPGVETVKNVRVSESGNISLPLVNQVHAEGLTEAQLESEIQGAYRTANLIPNAQVSVTVAQALARTFSILGTIQRPGQYQITQVDYRVLDALVSAGDISSQGVDYIYLIRRKDLAAGPRRGTATTPAPGAPAAPAAPGDALQPRSQADLANQPVYLADAPAAPSGDKNGEGKYIIVDNKPVLVGNQGAAAAPATPAPAAPAAPAEVAAPAANAPAAPTVGPAAAPAAAPAAQGFEFQNPMATDNLRVIRIPVTQLKNGDLRYNVVIKPQDMIIVPQPVTGEYYMDGHVNRTGVYNLTARKITVQQAVAAAGGFDQLALPMRTEIIRRIGEDRQVFALVDLDKIASGTQPDIYLKPNDVVRVGTTAVAPFIAAFRNAFRITYGFGFLYDRNYAPQQKLNNN